MKLFVKSLLAECLGTAMLLATVVGSGIMAVQLSQGNDALALLANTLATVFILYVLIEVFAPISGAHFNPVVTTIIVMNGHLGLVKGLCYIAAQSMGAILGVWATHTMFAMPVVQVSARLRDGFALCVAEAIATFGLVLVIGLSPKGKAAGIVAAYIGAAYWFTASTSFANPAAVLGRMFSDTFAGIAPQSALPFVLAQCAGGFLAWLTLKWLKHQDAQEN